MLECLHIRNLALIEDMTLEFSEGINVLSGETGAGKSFVLKALGFALGDRLSADIVRPGAEKAQVEALFSLDGEELVLRREIAASSGRSRFFINDSLGSQDALRELRARLLSHTSQRAQQRLLNPAFQAKLFENNFPEPQLLEKRDELLAKARDIARQIEELQEKQASLAEKRELLEMQKQEIDKVDPQKDEEEELEKLRAQARVRDAEKQNYNRAMSILHGENGYGLADALQDFERLLTQMGRDDPRLAEDADCVAAFRERCMEIANQLRRPRAESKKIDMDEIEERLFELAQLKRKLKRSLPEILNLKDEIEENLSFLDVCALDLSRLNKEKTMIEEELTETVGRIIPMRRQNAERFAAALEAQLKDLGFSEYARVIPDFEKQEIWPGINDESGRVLWAPNPGQNPQPLDKIASGGELSRFLLAIGVIGNQDENVTFIFDEVDAGVGGLTLNKVSEKLRSLAEARQIILITHWPQLAAKAKKHFRIRKEVRDGSTYTLCAPLSAEERKDELARMAGGGAKGLNLAKELLERD